MAKRRRWRFRQHIEAMQMLSKETPIMVHGGMKYRCQSCGKEWFMCLEIGVEDWGKNGRKHQPCPFFIMCECGELACDISGIISFGEEPLRPLLPGMRYFAYDSSGRENACGKPADYAADSMKTLEDRKHRMRLVKCKVCKSKTEPKRERTIRRNSPYGPDKYFAVMDCPTCGCEIILGKAK